MRLDSGGDEPEGLLRVSNSKWRALAGRSEIRAALLDPGGPPWVQWAPKTTSSEQLQTQTGFPLRNCRVPHPFAFFGLRVARPLTPRVQPHGGCPVLAFFARAGTQLPVATDVEVCRRGWIGFQSRPWEKSHSDVTPVLAHNVNCADHSQSESGVSNNQPTRPKSLRLKILPLSCWAP